MNRIRIGLMSVLFTGIGIGFAQNVPAIHAFSIKQAIDFAHLHNAQVKNALLDLKIQIQTNRVTAAGALPNISGTVNSTYFLNIPVQTFPNFISQATYGVLQQEGVRDGSGNPIVSPNDFGFISAPFGTKWNTSFGATLTQTLFDGKLFIGLKARQASIDYAQKAVDITDENIKVNIYKVYYQLVVSKTQMQQIDANVARAQKLMTDTKALFDNGFAEKLDVDKATVQLANIQTQKVSTQTGIDNGYLGLKYLLGMPIADSLSLTDQFTEDDLKSGVLDDSTYNYENRNEYQSLEIANKLSGYNVKSYRSAYLPVASLTGYFQKSDPANTFDVFTKNANWYTNSYVGFNLNIPIFSGFSKDANVQKAKLQQQQYQNQLDYFKISIDNDVAQAKNKFRSAILTVDFQKKNMSLAENVYNQTKKKFESGLASNTDVTNAQTDFITAQSGYINALYDAVVAKVDYNKATGKLK